MPVAEPLPDGKHLRLGITLEGIEYILERIGFPWVEYDGQMFVQDARPETINGRVEDYHPGTYKRDMEKLSWLPDDGFEEVMGEMVFVGTGYDLAECIRSFLQETGNDDLSINEVLFAENSEFVRMGCDVFLSHQQRFPIGVTLKNIRKGMYWHQSSFEDCDDDVFSWVDYFVLRQCRDDFKPAQVTEIIGEIGRTLIEADWPDFTYVERSFCVLEAYATLDQNAGMLIQTDWVPQAVAEHLGEKPIRVQDASTRREKDKKKIDDFILAGPGFDVMNKMITLAMERGANNSAISKEDMGEMTKVRNEVRQTFQQIDDNGDGTISRDELGFVMKRLGAFDQDALDEMFDQVDRNQDGKLSIDEFLDWAFFNEEDATELHAQMEKLEKVKVPDRAKGDARQKTETVVRCPDGHPLKKKRMEDNECNECEEIGTHYRCNRCDFDLCQQCYSEAARSC